MPHSSGGALTEEDHTEARITAAIRTEAQEEAHAT